MFEAKKNARKKKRFFKFYSFFSAEITQYYYYLIIRERILPILNAVLETKRAVRG